MNLTVFVFIHIFSFFHSSISSIDVFLMMHLVLVNRLIFFRIKHWTKASPWLTGINPRDAKMPKDGDDGFFPTTGNELVSY